MKKKSIKVLVLFALLLTLTGCTKYIKNDGKVVKNPETGQSLPQNILCQVEDEKTIEIYKENGINMEDYPKCSEFKVTSGGYDGSLFSAIFVKPLAWLIIKFGILFKNYGVAIILVTLLIRLAMYPMTKKTAMQSEKMKYAQKELSNLEAKYKDKKDQQSMMQKSQEMMIIYKKYNINPISGCLFALIQIPLFFSFYEAMNRLPAIFEENFLGFQLGTSPLTAIQNGKYYYIIFVVLVAVATFYSFKLNSGASMSPDQAKQMKMFSKISVVMITVAAITMSVGIQLYWIFNSTFTIAQNLLVKRMKKNVVIK